MARTDIPLRTAHPRQVTLSTTCARRDCLRSENVGYGTRNFAQATGSASRILHDALQRPQIGHSRAPSPDLELVTDAADCLTSTAAALVHVFSYLPAGEALVPTVCALAERLPTARPGRDHWKELRHQWALPQEALWPGSRRQSVTTRSQKELVDKVRSVQWDLLLDSHLPEEALVGAIPAFWRMHIAARSLSEVSSKRDSNQSSVRDAWTSWCDAVAEGSERTIAAILIDGVKRHLDRFAYESGLPTD